MNTTGLFISVYPDKESKNNLADFIKFANVPNAVEKSRLHCTIMHSQSHAFVKENKHCDVVAKSEKLEVWALPDKGMGVKYALVLLLDSPVLTNRYNELRLYGTECQYDEFRPHITLSMDVPKWFLSRGARFNRSIRFVREEVKECRGADAPL